MAIVEVTISRDDLSDYATDTNSLPGNWASINCQSYLGCVPSIRDWSFKYCFGTVEDAAYFSLVWDD